MSRHFGVVAIAVLLASCGGTARTEGTPIGPRVTDDQRRAWPSTEIGPAASCISVYPDRLAGRAFAFDGTILAVTRGDYDRDAGAAPVDLELRVNEVFRGDLGEVVTMHTWSFMLPGHDVTGTRILASAGPTLDLMACGYTRPYSEEDADHWRGVFNT